METFWYVVVTLMLAVYVVLDGFDFGVGILYPFAARTELERRTALASIGPVWNGYFFVAFWTTFTPGAEPGILDWYTVLMGLTSAAILAMHGANYLVMKTEGALSKRADSLGRLAGWIAAGLTGLAVLAIPFVRPGLMHNYVDHPIGYLFPIAGGLALGAAIFLRGKRREVGAFFASTLFIFAMLGSAAWGVYPNLLIATTDPANSLTAFNAVTSPYGLRLGLIWFPVGISLVIAYQVYVY